LVVCLAAAAAAVASASGAGVLHARLSTLRSAFLLVGLGTGALLYLAPQAGTVLAVGLGLASLSLLWSLRQLAAHLDGRADHSAPVPSQND
jgi:hypothetical protein